MGRKEFNPEIYVIEATERAAERERYLSNVDKLRQAQRRARAKLNGSFYITDPEFQQSTVPDLDASYVDYEVSIEVLKQHYDEIDKALSALTETALPQNQEDADLCMNLVDWQALADKYDESFRSEEVPAVHPIQSVPELPRTIPEGILSTEQSAFGACIETAPNIVNILTQVKAIIDTKRPQCRHKTFLVAEYLFHKLRAGQIYNIPIAQTDISEAKGISQQAVSDCIERLVKLKIIRHNNYSKKNQKAYRYTWLFRPTQNPVV